MLATNLSLKHRADWTFAEGSDGLTATCGSAFKANTLLAGSSLTNVFRAETEAPFYKTITDLNGFFAVVHQTPESLFAAVDRVRSIPLFYGSNEGCFFLSDSAQWIKEQLAAPLDPVRRAEFRLTGYTTGDTTLYKGVKQLQAGEMLSLSKSKPELVLKSYDTFGRKPVAGRSSEELFEELELVTRSAFSRLLEWTNGRTLVVPLSGGYDSRLIVTMLKAFNYTNVLTFTYGLPGNSEARVSQELAKNLDLPWTFVPYSHKDWHDSFHSQERSNYYAFATQHSSLPNLQDWPAVSALARRKNLSDCAFVPGHVGGFLADAKMPARFLWTLGVKPQVLLTELLDQHYNLWPLEDFGALGLDQELSARLPSDSVSTETALTTLETWNWRERQAKFIINSLRTYEFWGSDWWLPLGDLDLMRFWQGVPLEQRVGKALHAHYIAENYAKHTGTHTGTTVATQPSSLARYTPTRYTPAHYTKGLLKRTLPTNWFERLKYKQRCAAYDAHPLAWYGWLERSTFEKYCAQHSNINSFLVKEALDTLGEP